MNLNEILKKHPIFTNVEAIENICKPLELLGITYFNHVHVDKKGGLSTIGKNPGWIERCIKEGLQNAHIHMASEEEGDRFVVWDLINTPGTEKMSKLSWEYDIKHTFMITEKIDRNKDGNIEVNYYHFATDSNENSFNQIYLSNLDLLKCFIDSFKEKVQNSRELNKAYDLKFVLDPNSDFYLIKQAQFREIERIRKLVKEALSLPNTKEIRDYIENDAFNRRESLLPSLEERTSNEQNYNNKFDIQKIDIQTKLKISNRQAECIYYLIRGKNMKQIAKALNLSPRTIEYYILNLKQKFNCRNRSELIDKLYS